MLLAVRCCCQRQLWRLPLLSKFYSPQLLAAIVVDCLLKVESRLVASRRMATLMVSELALPLAITNLGTRFPSSSAGVVDPNNEMVPVGRIHRVMAAVMNP